MERSRGAPSRTRSNAWPTVYLATPPPVTGLSDSTDRPQPESESGDRRPGHHARSPCSNVPGDPWARRRAPVQGDVLVPPDADPERRLIARSTSPIPRCSTELSQPTGPRAADLEHH